MSRYLNSMFCWNSTCSSQSQGLGHTERLSPWHQPDASSLHDTQLQTFPSWNIWQQILLFPSPLYVWPIGVQVQVKSNYRLNYPFQYNVTLISKLTCSPSTQFLSCNQGVIDYIKFWARTCFFTCSCMALLILKHNSLWYYKLTFNSALLFLELLSNRIIICDLPVLGSIAFCSGWKENTVFHGQMIWWCSAGLIKYCA